MNAHLEQIPETNAPTRDRESGVGAAISGPQGVIDLGKHFTTALTNGSRRVS